MANYKVDFIVIGGGVAGVSAAYHLASLGASVELLEQFDLGSRASGANAGSLHGQIPHDSFVQYGEEWAHRFMPVVQLCAQSILLWRDLDTATGGELHVEVTGGIILAADSHQMRQIESKAAIDRSAGLTIEMLDRAELSRRAPYVSDAMIGGSYCHQEGKADPLRAAAALARSAESMGAVVRCGCRVEAIRREGREYHVRTNHGTFVAEQVIDAAGEDADRIASMVGVRLRLQRFPLQLSVTEPCVPLLSHLVYHAAAPLTLKQTHAGTIVIGGGWPARVDSHGRSIVDPESLARNLGVAVEAVPALASLQLVRSWAAIVSGTDEWMPILGECPGQPGFHVCYVPWLGFTAAPFAGSLVANLALGRRPDTDFDPDVFRPGKGS